MEQRWEDCDSLLGPGATLRRLMGLWRPRGRLARLLNVVLAGVTLGCTAFQVTCAALKLFVDTPEELDQITLSSLVATICSGFFVRAALFIYMGGTLRQTVQLLADTRARFCSGEHNEATRRRYQTLSNNIHYYAQMVTVPACVTWIAVPILSHFFTKTDHEQEEGLRQLPTPIWLPVDIYQSPNFELLYVMQSCSVLIATESCLITDVFFIHLMLMVAAELEVLNDNISAMGYTELQNLGTERQECVPKFKRNGRQLALITSGQFLGDQIVTEDAVNELLHQQLIKNVLHHRAILRCVSLLQSAMNVSIFSLLFVNMANLCSCMFVASILFQREGSIGKALNALSTIPAQLYETSLYLFAGQVMTDQSERLTNSAFSCDWVNSDNRFKRSLLMFMMMTGRPIVITVGKTCKLSKQMLLQVLNGTYALLNMLCNTH